MVDFGYDITDHCDVDPIFGTLADADALIAQPGSTDPAAPLAPNEGRIMRRG